jgi:hypothetical protein
MVSENQYFSLIKYNHLIVSLSQNGIAHARRHLRRRTTLKKNQVMTTGRAGGLINALKGLKY